MVVGEDRSTMPAGDRYVLAWIHVSLLIPLLVGVTLRGICIFGHRIAALSELVLRTTKEGSRFETYLVPALCDSVVWVRHGRQANCPHSESHCRKDVPVVEGMRSIPVELEKSKSLKRVLMVRPIYSKPQSWRRAQPVGRQGKRRIPSSIECNFDSAGPGRLRRADT